jgi:hypothetical protein
MVMVYGLLYGWLDDPVDESLGCKGRWVKRMMKQVTVVVEELAEKISNIPFCIKIGGKILLEVFCGSAGCNPPQIHV